MSEKPRKGRQYDPLGEEDLLVAAQQGRNPYPEPEAEEDNNIYDFDTSELVWRDYGIKPNLPLKVKVEQLLVTYRVDAIEIARVLKTDRGLVEEVIANLQTEWASMGRVPTPEERDIARGRMIAELNRMVADIDKAMAGASNSDKARLLNLRMGCLNQITNMQGLGLAKNEMSRADEDISDPFEAAVKALDAATQERLHTLLNPRQEAAGDSVGFEVGSPTDSEADLEEE